MVESKFKKGSLLAIISSLLLFSILLFALIRTKDSTFPLYASIPLSILILFIIAWIIFGELRTKALRIQIENNQIIVRNYLGVGTKREYIFSEFDGYRIAILPSEHQEYEYLYLLINRKKKIIISQFYHRNYFEIKNVIIKKTKNLGKENFSLIGEIKEIFKA